jgi:hypothetical protein
MYEKKLAQLLQRDGIRENEILIELKKYRTWVSDSIVSSCARRQAMFIKRKKDLETQRKENNFKTVIDYINKKIESGKL